MNTDSIHLFVYGSLRSGFRNPAYEYLTRYFTYKGEAIAQGKFLENGAVPVAIPSTEEKFILGELYTLQNKEEFSWAFVQLDDYEGLNTEPGETPLYKREKVKVYQPGETGEAWIYWYNGITEGLKEIETGDVMKYLQQKHQ